MKLRDLEAILQSMEPFDTSVQKVDLEQYTTNAHLASRLIFTAATTYDDIEGKTVVDLGTGTAMLGIHSHPHSSVDLIDVFYLGSAMCAG
jgi:rRNA N6-adenosine-methyltransferase METTL5